MKQWWSDRSPRERTMLAGVAGVMIVLMLFQFGLRPLLSYRQSAAASYESAAILLSEVEAAAQEIVALQSVVATGSGGVSRVTISTTAAQFSLPITRLQPHENAGLDVWLDNVAPVALFKWLDAMYHQHGISVVRASVQKNADGATVNAQFTFSAGAES